MNRQSLTGPRSRVRRVVATLASAAVVVGTATLVSASPATADVGTIDPYDVHTVADSGTTLEEEFYPVDVEAASPSYVADLFTSEVLRVDSLSSSSTVFSTVENLVAVDRATAGRHVVATGGAVYLQDLAGESTTQVATLPGVSGLAVDDSDHVYVAWGADPFDIKIDRFQLTPPYARTTVVTGISRPTRVDVDNNGNIYYSDGYDLKRFDADTETSSVVVSTFDGPINGIALGGDGAIYFGATNFEVNGSLLWRYTQARGLDLIDLPTETFKSISGIYADGTDVYVSDLGTKRVLKVELEVPGDPQTITFPDLDDLLIERNQVLKATSDKGTTVSYAAAPEDVCHIDGFGDDVIVVGDAAGECTVTAAAKGGDGILDATPVDKTFTVKKHPQTLTIEPLADLFVGQDQDIDASSTADVVPALEAGPESVCALGDGDYVVAIAPGTCTVTATEAGGSFFDAATPVSKTFEIGKRTQTITFAPLGGLLVGASQPVAPTASSELLVGASAGPEGVCHLTDGFVIADGPGTCSVTATQEGNKTYQAAEDVTRTFQVSTVPVNNPDPQPEPQPVTKKKQSITLGALAGGPIGTVNALDASASSQLPVTLAAGPAGVCHIDGSTVVADGAGTCSVTATQAGNDEYEAAAAVTGSFTVTKRTQSIAFDGLADLEAGAQQGLAASATSSLAVAFGAGPAGVCHVDGTSVVADGAGTCSVTATQPGNDTYAAADDVTRSFAVTAVKVNKNPAIAGGSAQLLAGARTKVEISVSDPDLDDLKVSAKSVPGLDVTIAQVADGQATVTITATKAASGDYSVPVTVNDGKGGKDQAAVAVRVSPRSVNGLAAKAETNGSQMVVSWNAAPTAGARYEVRAGDKTVTTKATSVKLPATGAGTRVSVKVLGLDGTSSKAEKALVTNAVAGTFYFDSAIGALTGKQYDRMVSLVKRLKAKGYTRVVVRGYTDPLGSDEANLALSKERAQGVAAYLRGNGIDVVAEWFGESQQIGNDPAKNRRVVLIAQ
ncbi:OmpA family protein [Nocardioides sp. SR21]|uniref:OmpA family protein n=1 Tax=Nocardioides sp. SR21 TaxID=2919501 RepID=UPI001FAADFBF|nr:OmpA family protein [Nocardioides sp. SR21]